MELKEYWEILTKEKVLFWSLFLGIIMGGLMFFIFQTDVYGFEMSIDVGRENSLKLERTGFKKELNYDYYYRLEADDNFTKNVVAWLSDAKMKQAIFSLATKKAVKNKINSNFTLAKKRFKAKQLAPNYIKIKSKLIDEAQAEILYQSIKEIIQERNHRLANFNQTENELPWFKLIFYQPLSYLYKISFSLSATMSILVGFWVSFFAVLIKHYWEK